MNECKLKHTDYAPDDVTWGPIPYCSSYFIRIETNICNL